MCYEKDKGESEMTKDDFTIGAGLLIAITLMVILAGAGLMVSWKVVFGSASEWQVGQEICTDIWQQTHNETLYYSCFIPFDTVREE